jgi:HAD superfamily hydrolase (TIGR01509 family)
LPKAVVFDCDGVLVDSETAVFDATVAVFARRGVHGLSAGPDSPLYGASIDTTVAELERLTGEPVNLAEVVHELDTEIRAVLARGVRAMDGAIELVRALAGSRPLGVASNGSRATVEVTLRAAAIPDVFGAVVTFEAPLRPKPAPDIYLRACELLGVAPTDAIAIEDSLPGARSARTAGLMVVGVGPAPGLGSVADALVADLRDPELLGLLGLGTLGVHEPARSGAYGAAGPMTGS